MKKNPLYKTLNLTIVAQRIRLPPGRKAPASPGSPPLSKVHHLEACARVGVCRYGDAVIRSTVLRVLSPPAVITCQSPRGCSGGTMKASLLQPNTALKLARARLKRGLLKAPGSHWGKKQTSASIYRWKSATNPLGKSVCTACVHSSRLSRRDGQVWLQWMKEDGEAFPGNLSWLTKEWSKMEVSWREAKGDILNSKMIPSSWNGGKVQRV